MCGGIQYQDHKIYFPQPDARLPVRLRSGNVTWMIGVTARRKETGAFLMAAGHGWTRLKQVNGNLGTQDRF